MKKFFTKIFGGLNITWPKLIILAITLGIYTALMAMFAPDGISFHDIAVTPEWWVLPAILIIVNSQKPLEAALKTFVFFLISQPLVYLIQVPFNPQGWGIFSYYQYWFIATLLTFPGSYIGWFIKKDKWYSGLILSVITALLVYLGANYLRVTTSSFPSHLLTTIYCFGIIPVFIFGILKDKWAKIIAVIVTLVALVPSIATTGAEEFQTYNNTMLEANNITLTDDAKLINTNEDSNYGAQMNRIEDGTYVFVLSGVKGDKYTFTISDGDKEYDFVYYFDDDLQTVIVEKAQK